jgi:hypothetical protein
MDKFSRYTWIYFVQHKSDANPVFQTCYNLVEKQFSAKIKTLKIDNRGEHLNNKMTAILETKGIIHDLSLPYAHKCNDLPNHINRTGVMIVRSMTLNYLI